MSVLRSLTAAACLVAALAAPRAARADIDHAPWDTLLRAHVSGGRVDYRGMARDRARLDAYLAAVAGASGDLGLPFWINAYNALVVRSVLDRGRPARVLDVAGFFDKLEHAVAGRKMTLNHLENEVIRKRFSDPRVHFALNCAARSCPPLHDRAFAAADLSAKLDRLTRAFLDGPGARPDPGARTLAVSRLFEWYRADFVAASGSIEGYLRAWIREPSRRKALDEGFTVTFQDYDWTLNAK